MSALNGLSFVGFFILLAVAWVCGGFRKPALRTLAGSVALAFGLGALIFLVPLSRRALAAVNDAILGLLSASTSGAEFLLGPLAVSPGRSTSAGEPSIGFVLAAQVLPAVVFFAAIMAMLHHLGLIAPVVRWFGRVFFRTLRLSGAEALVSSLHLFFGVESGAAIRPYLERMTRSELLTVLATNLATTASTTLAIYVLFLRDVFPQIAGHLVSASILSIPCAVLTTKLILPEDQKPETAGEVPELESSERHGNVIAALAAGANNGVKIAVGIAAILIAILGVVGVLDSLLGRIGEAVDPGSTWSIAGALGVLFVPAAWLLGLEAADLRPAAELLGQRLILTEVFSYQQLGALASAGELSERSLLVVSYALCGFAHIGGVGIALGGFGALAPSRLDDLAALGLRALLAATLATLLTGCLAGCFYYGQGGLLGL